MARRIEQINALLQQEIGAIIARDIELPKGTMATILFVRTAGDLKNATVGVSLFPDAQRGDILAMLKKNTRHIELLLQGRIPVHHIPVLSWTVDTTEQKASEVETLLDHVRSLREKNLA